MLCVHLPPRGLAFSQICAGMDGSHAALNARNDRVPVFCVALCQVDPLFAPARIDVCLTCSTQLKTHRKIGYSGTLLVAINIIGVELPHAAHTMHNKAADSSYILNFYCVIPPEDIRWFLSFIFRPNYLYMWRQQNGYDLQWIDRIYVERMCKLFYSSIHPSAFQQRGRSPGSF